MNRRFAIRIEQQLNLRPATVLQVVGRTELQNQLRKVLMRIGLNMWQSTCLLINPITVTIFAPFFKLHAGGSGFRMIVYLLVLHDGPLLVVWLTQPKASVTHSRFWPR